MAILATIKSGAGKIAGKVANKGGNIVAKASGLSSAQLEKIEEKRNDYLSEKPETDPGRIKRLLGSYAIEAYEAYLPQLSELYKPMSIGEANDERSLDNRIRYFEVTKWVTDPTEDNLDKLTNMYHVLSEEDCNIALIFNRRVNGTTIYFAVVNNGEKDMPYIADMFGKRLESSLLGNFPGAEIKKLPHDKLNAGVVPVLKNVKNSSVAIVSNIASEKSEKFISQSVEKLIDGIVPSNELEEYTIVLLATPVKDQLDRKLILSKLYSDLAPYASYSTTFTLSETTAVAHLQLLGQISVVQLEDRLVIPLQPVPTVQGEQPIVTLQHIQIPPITVRLTAQTAVRHQAQVTARINLQVTELIAVQVLPIWWVKTVQQRVE